MNFENMSKEELIEYINNLNEEHSGKYGLVWDAEKVAEQVVVDCNKLIPVLKEVENKEINNGGEDNVLIEGDNFHSLSVLNYTHKESIDVIYIDPPYNTGNNDFKYNDKYVDLTDGYRHSKWLNFMSKRLQLARNLLKDEGVIFISIDYHEYAQLKILCDKIFDESNYLETIIQNKGNAQNDATDIQHNHEYILIYRKKIRTSKKGNKTIILPTLSNKKTIKKEVFYDNKGYYYMTGSFTTGSSPTLNERPNMGWSIYYNDFTKDMIGIQDYDVTLARESNDEAKIYHPNQELLNKGYEIIRAPKKGNKLGRWSWSLDTFEKNKENVVISKRNKENYSINVKKYISDENNVTELNGKYYYEEKIESNSKSIIDFSSSYGTSILKEIIDNDIEFNNPKNSNMIKYLISLMPNKSAIVLDFFAGSGTTAQAVLELNNEDGGNRKFILCTNNENNICEDITYQRIKTVITGKRKDGSEYSKGLPGSLKYFKTEFVENNSTRDQIYFDLTEKCVPMLCVKESTFDLVEKTDSYVIYKDKNDINYTCIYFDIYRNYYDEFINKIKDINNKKALYIFSLDNRVEEYELDGITNYKVEAIPQKIYDLYRKLVKLSKEN